MNLRNDGVDRSSTVSIFIVTLGGNNGWQEPRGNGGGGRSGLGGAATGGVLRDSMGMGSGYLERHCGERAPFVII